MLGIRNGTSRTYVQHGPVVARGSGCLYLQCFVSELVLAVFGGISPNSYEVVLGQRQNQCFWKSFAFKMPKRCLAICRSKVDVIICGRWCPNITRRSFFFWRTVVLMFPRLTPITTAWGMKAVLSLFLAPPRGRGRWVLGCKIRVWPSPHKGVGKMAWTSLVSSSRCFEGTSARGILGSGL